MSSDQNNVGQIATGLTVAGAIVAATLGLNWAEAEGFVGGDASLRAAIVLTGLALAWLGNQIPKAIVHSSQARAARRFSGWVFALAGLASAAGGAFLPIGMAVNVELAVIGGAVALVLLVCVALRGETHPTV